MFGAVAVDDERIVVEADRRIATAAGVSPPASTWPSGWRTGSR